MADDVPRVRVSISGISIEFYRRDAFCRPMQCLVYMLLFTQFKTSPILVIGGTRDYVEVHPMIYEEEDEEYRVLDHRL